MSWRRHRYSYRRILKMLDALIALAFFILPLLSADIILTGRAERIVLYAEKVYERGNYRDVPIEAYSVSIMNPLEAVVRFLIFFTAFYVIIKASKDIDPKPPSHRYYPIALGYLVSAQLLIWLPAWLFSARFTPFVDVMFRSALNTVNLISAGHISYWITLYRYFTAPGYFWIPAFILISLMWAACPLGDRALKLVKRAAARRVKAKVLKRILESRDPIDAFVKELMSLQNDASELNVKMFGSENFADLMLRARCNALGEALNRLPRGAAAKINSKISDFHTKNADIWQLMLKIREKEMRDNMELRTVQQRSVEVWPQQPPREPRQPPHQIQEQIPREPQPQRPHEAKPQPRPSGQGSQRSERALPREVEERLIREAEERKRLQERMALYESIKSLKIFDRVVGLEEVKEEIAWRFLIPVLFPEQAPKGIKPKLGILLYGPPGIGKTEIMRALKDACERLGLRTFEIKPTDVDKKYVGVGEENIRRIFAEARKAPSVIFIDEAEVAMSRDQPIDSGYHRGPRAQLLREIEGLESESAKILVIAATNKPWKIDEAFMRPGRMDRIFYIKPPGREERMELFRRGLRSVEAAEPIDCERLANLTEPSRAGYYSGADIMEICKRAILRAAKSNRKVLMADLEAAVREVKPSIPIYLLAEFDTYSGVRYGEVKEERKPFYTT